MLTNPVVLSVLLMCVLCLFSFNVILAIIASALLAGVLGGSSIEATASALTSGPNADSQHSHIYDACVPTFLFFNIPLVIGALIFSVIL